MVIALQRDQSFDMGSARIKLVRSGGRVPKGSALARNDTNQVPRLPTFMGGSKVVDDEDDEEESEDEHESDWDDPLPASMVPPGRSDDEDDEDEDDFFPNEQRSRKKPKMPRIARIPVIPTVTIETDEYGMRLCSSTQVREEDIESMTLRAAEQVNAHMWVDCSGRGNKNRGKLTSGAKIQGMVIYYENDELHVINMSNTHIHFYKDAATFDRAIDLTVVGTTRAEF